MPIFTPRSMVLALACLMPLGGAAHSAASEAAFEQSFASYESLPATPEAGVGVVDLDMVEPTIEPTHENVSELGSGVASYYGSRFNGRPTASGERFDMTAMTAAHRTLPFGSLVRLTNQSNGKTVVVRINDRGPYHSGRTIDVSRAAATELGLIGRGHGTVDLALID
ncbi:septal ring lytic transglycosylase RlpA family protein [Qipengyuania sp.]|uniref:septal ring lytic transglycosylase RlpA family protein n=1 Tax=Qipengyuania sp. TaxID=2004515 RepID=UPI0035C7E634